MRPGDHMAVVSVVMLTGAGWQQTTMTLAGWGRARARIERDCEFVHVVLVGALA